MEKWHSVCGTKHCRAGWAVHLAEKAGKELEEATDTAFAALMIYRASSKIPVSLSAFFVSNEEAMKDMIRCAEEERTQW